MMEAQEFWQAVQSIGLGGAGWVISLILYREVKELRGQVQKMMQEQHAEAQKRAELLEARLFDMQASRALRA